MVNYKRLLYGTGFIPFITIPLFDTIMGTLNLLCITLLLMSHGERDDPRDVSSKGSFCTRHRSSKVSFYRRKQVE